MEQVEIILKKRTETGKNACRRMRAGGFIPGILYGLKKDSVQVALDPTHLHKILHSRSGANTLCALKVEGEEGAQLAMIKDYQLNPITQDLLHADFILISMETRITVKVPIHLTGEARGVKEQGGVMDFVHREIEVECLPDRIPERIEVDVSELMVGDFIKFEHIKTKEGVVVLSDPEDAFVHVAAPRKEVEEEAAEEVVEEEGAEPEVIGKKKKAEEEGEAEDSKKPEGE
ncbi:50S ribosomal protein L25 [Acidobacteriota bacterium]